MAEPEDREPQAFGLDADAILKKIGEIETRIAECLDRLDAASKRPEPAALRQASLSYAS